MGKTPAIHQNVVSRLSRPRVGYCHCRQGKREMKNSTRLLSIPLIPSLPVTILSFAHGVCANNMDMRPQLDI